MNLFDQYGIKEVADVTIYSIHRKEDGSGDVYYVPALYLDTLKVTSTEKTADNTWAEGGHGNSRLISWDYNKQINLTIEDALCTPASLGLCWGGVLSADWKDAQVRQQYGITDNNCNGGVERISRFEKAFYPRNDAANAVVSNLLPRDGNEDILPDQHGDLVYLKRSSVLDGTEIRGFGYVDSHPYKWRLEIETAVKSVAVVPDRFFSKYGKGYPIKRKQTVGINQPSESFKYEIIYLRGFDQYDDGDKELQARIIYHKQAEENIKHEYVCSEDKEALKLLDDFDNYPFLKIRVCFDGSIRAYLGHKTVGWDYTREIHPEDNAADPNKYWIEVPQINTEQFRGIDLWLRFDSINALSYYLITKYEDNIFSISPVHIHNGLQNVSRPSDGEGVTHTSDSGSIDHVVGKDYDLDPVSTVEDNGMLDTCVPCCKKANLSRSIWAYVNPKTMTPYDDDYWFHQGEPFFKKSLTLSTKEAPLKAKKIVINAGEFPGMYKIVGETYIRQRDTGEDERVQLVFPLCKIMSNQSLVLQSDGEPTTFNLDVEVAVPQNGISMEMNFYEVEKDMKLGCCGNWTAKDGSTKISAK